MHANLRIIACFAISLSSLSAFAFEPLNTDDAKTVGLGWSQIEAYYYRITANGTSEQSTGVSPGEEFLAAGNSNALPMTYTYGFGENIEGMVSATYFMTPRGDYSPLTNYVFGFKWQYLGAPSDGLGLSVKPTISLPAGTQQQEAGLGNAAFNYGINLIGSYYWKSFDIHVNATYDREPYNTNFSVAGSSDTQRKNVYGFSIAPIWNFAPKTSLALDLGFGTNTPTASSTIANAYLMGALIFTPIPTIDLAIAYLTSDDNPGQLVSNNRSSRTNSNRFEIGATFRFK